LEIIEDITWRDQLLQEQKGTLKPFSILMTPMQLGPTNQSILSGDFGSAIRLVAFSPYSQTSSLDDPRRTPFGHIHQHPWYCPGWRQNHSLSTGSGISLIER
jgi:hypothetical protein